MILAYARVSTTEQAGDGTTSIGEQLRRCRAIADLRNADAFDFVKYVDAGVSGSIPLNERPAGREMLTAAKARDVIVASKMDRLFRSASDALNTAESLKKQNVDLILTDIGADPVTGTGPAKLFFTILGGVAEFERYRIAERMTEGRNGKRARNGRIGAVPYGWKAVGHGRQAILEPVADEQETIQLICAFRRNRSYAQIVRELDTRSVRTRSGRPFQIVQVARIVERARQHG